MHVGWKATFRPAVGRPPITLDAIRALVRSRLERAPRFRERLAFPPAGMAEPVWVDDERFDLAYHVAGARRGAVAADPRAVRRARRPRPLRAARPDPRAVAPAPGAGARRRHDRDGDEDPPPMVDGKSAVELGLLLLDLDADAPAPAPEAEDWSPAAAPGTTRMAVDAMLEAGAESLRMVRGMAARPRPPASRERSRGRRCRCARTFCAPRRPPT